MSTVLNSYISCCQLTRLKKLRRICRITPGKVALSSSCIPVGQLRYIGSFSMSFIHWKVKKNYIIQELYNEMAFLPFATLKKRRKSICGGRCWYCGGSPQINQCMGNPEQNKNIFGSWWNWGQLSRKSEKAVGAVASLRERRFPVRNPAWLEPWG